MYGWHQIGTQDSFFVCLCVDEVVHLPRFHCHFWGGRVTGNDSGTHHLRWSRMGIEPTKTGGLSNKNLQDLINKKETKKWEMIAKKGWNEDFPKRIGKHLLLTWTAKWWVQCDMVLLPNRQSDLRVGSTEWPTFGACGSFSQKLGNLRKPPSKHHYSGVADL